MSSAGAPWTTPAYGAARPGEARRSAGDVAAFCLSVLIILIYSQAWMAPLFGAAADESASGLIRDMYFPAYGAALAVIALSLKDTGRAMLRQPLLLLILTICSASILWSVAPDATERRIVAITFTTLGGVAVGARYRWSQLAEVLATTFAVLAVLSFLAGAFAPAIGRMTVLFPGAWRGLWQEKNALGGNMTIAFVVFVAAAMLEPRRRRLWGAMAVLAVVLVILSTSKTSLVSLMLGGSAMAFVALARRGPIMGVISSFGAVVVIFAALAFVFFAADVAFAFLGKDATLTGRTNIWQGVMYEIRQRPWLGYGYGAVWDDKTGWGPVYWITKIAGFRAAHAHNSWLEQWLGLGVAGLAAWSLYFAQTLILAIVAVYRDKGAYLALPFILVYGLVSLTESIAVVYNDFRWVMFVAVAVKLAYPDRAMAVRQAFQAA
ncbi:MAG TPA: O-antigen ligase [Caulobacteraceae bacterium]|nr:O-antigen ligase [Caulobacteraceae bacterium]